MEIEIDIYYLVMFVDSFKYLIVITFAGYDFELF